MITAALTGLITWILSLFGVKPSPAGIAITVVIVKACVVLTGVLLGAKAVQRQMKKKEAAGEKPADASGPEVPGEH